MIETPVSAPIQQIPKIMLPDRESRSWYDVKYTHYPKAPLYKAKLVLLANPFTSGTAEVFLSLAKQLKLGDIAGLPTAGAPRLSNRADLPGGYSLMLS